MEPIYTFNGQDITMLVCILIRDITHEISKKEKISFPDALKRFCSSDTYITLKNTENALWAEPVGYITDMYFAEKNKKQSICA